MRVTISIALLLVACGDDGAREGMDASVDRFDMAPNAERDAFVTTSDGGTTPDATAPPDGARPTEDCGTDADEDGDGNAGCADTECIDVQRCIDADLAERGLSEHTLCQSLTFDAGATRTRCEEGLPAWTESERELRCDLVPTEVRVDVYCPPEPTEPTDDPVEVQMRWRVAMDLTGSNRMLGPNAYESTSYQAELLFSNTVTEYGAGGSGGDPLYPTMDHWDEQYRAIGWRSFPQGARFVAFTTVSVEVSTIVLHDGGATVDSSGPSYVHNAAFEVPSVGVGE